MYKKWFAVLTALILLLSLTGCGDADPNTYAGMSAENLAAAVKENVGNLNSWQVSSVIHVTCHVKLPYFSDDYSENRINLTQSIQYFGDADHFKIEMIQNNKISGRESISTIYFVYTDGVMTTYTNSDPDAGWTKTSLPLTADAAKTSSGSPGGLFSFYDDSCQVTDLGTKTVNRTATRKLQIELPKDVYSSMGGVLDSLSEYIGDIINPVIDSMSGMKMVCYIDTQTGYPVSIEIDMLEYMNKLFKALYNKIDPEASIFVSHSDMIMDFSDYNKVPDFEIPAEALAAIEK